VGFVETVRKHFVLPKALADEFEQVAGERKQSEKLAEIIERWLKRQRLLDVVETHAGFMTSAAHPEWATNDDITAWVRHIRAEWPDRHPGSRDDSTGPEEAGA
jgi:hypothetical protein